MTQLLADEPDRLLVWIDDELSLPTRFRRWADSHERVRAVGPAPMLGLTASDLAEIAEHLGRPLSR